MHLKTLVLLLSASSLLQRSALAVDEPTDSSTLERSPRLLMFVRSGESETERELETLRAPGGTFEILEKQGWKIGSGTDAHLQVIEADRAAELVRRWEIKDYPTVICVEGVDVVRSFREGCSTPLDVYTFRWLLSGVSDRPAESPTALVSVPTSGSYQLRGNHWNFEGHWNPGHDYMVHHLRGPNHASLYPVSWPIEKWSEEELRSLHDDLHEMGRPRLPLDRRLEPGNSVRPGEMVPVYRPASQSQVLPQAASTSSSAQKAGATSAAARASRPFSGSTRTSGSVFF